MLHWLYFKIKTPRTARSYFVAQDGFISNVLQISVFVITVYFPAALTLFITRVVSGTLPCTTVTMVTAAWLKY